MSKSKDAGYTEPLALLREASRFVAQQGEIVAKGIGLDQATGHPLTGAGPEAAAAGGLRQVARACATIIRALGQRRSEGDLAHQGPSPESALARSASPGRPPITPTPSSRFRRPPPAQQAARNTSRMKLTRSSGGPLRRSPSPMAAHRAPVAADHDHQDQEAEAVLHPPGEARRIDDPDQVMRDETAPVPRFSSPAAQVVLQRGQRAGEADEFHHGAVHGHRDMHPRGPRPAPGEEGAEDDEADEQKVDDDDGVGGHAVPHLIKLDAIGAWQDARTAADVVDDYPVAMVPRRPVPRALGRSRTVAQPMTISPHNRPIRAPRPAFSDDKRLTPNRRTGARRGVIPLCGEDLEQPRGRQRARRIRRPTASRSDPSAWR